MNRDLGVALLDRLEVDAGARSCRGCRYDPRSQTHGDQIEDSCRR